MSEQTIPLPCREMICAWRHNLSVESFRFERPRAMVARTDTRLLRSLTLHPALWSKGLLARPIKGLGCPWPRHSFARSLAVWLGATRSLCVLWFGGTAGSRTRFPVTSVMSRGRRAFRLAFHGNQGRTAAVHPLSIPSNQRTWAIKSPLRVRPFRA